MKFDHAVKYNGVIYPAGANVPVGEPPKVEIEEPKQEVKQVVKKQPVKPIVKKPATKKK